MVESEPEWYGVPVKKFKSVGFVKLAASGKSFKLEITPPFSTFTETFYINRVSLVQVDKGHRQEATVFVLEAQDESPRE